MRNTGRHESSPLIVLKAQPGQHSASASTNNHAPSYEACILHDCRCMMTDQRAWSLPTNVEVTAMQMLYLLKPDRTSEHAFSRLWCQSTNRHVWRDDDCLMHVTAPLRGIATDLGSEDQPYVGSPIAPALLRQCNAPGSHLTLIHVESLHVTGDDSTNFHAGKGLCVSLPR